MKLRFDSSNIPEKPTFALAYKNGRIITGIEAENIITRDCMNNPFEASFKVKKYLNNSNNVYWDQIKDFRLLWYKEADVWLEMYVDKNQTTEIVKTITAKQLGQAELGQIKLFSVEINTEKDIAREDYMIPTVLYNPEHPEASMLHRVMEKAPHYKIRHVGDTIRNIQRSFSFHNIAIPDALNQIATEIGCLVVYHSGTDINGMIEREISVYDLQSVCMNPECNYRGEFTAKCPKCGCTDINEGYGEDTTIFVTADELADNLNLTNNRDAVKNCFKLEAGDELMTATIKNCNPNGSDYLWYIPEYFKNDMSQELQDRLVEYDKQYHRYVNEYEVNPQLYNQYADLIKKYIVYSNVEELELPANGFSSLMEAIYHTIDMELFLRSGLMPVIEVADTNAELQSRMLTAENLSPVSVADISKISLASANNAVLSMAKTIIDSRYKIKIDQSTLDGVIWQGNFIVTNYSDEEDTCTSTRISVNINDDYTEFVEQKLNKLLGDEEPKDYSISGIFKYDYYTFCKELKKYSLNILTSLKDMAQTCINFLIEQGVSQDESWGDNLYEKLYEPRYAQLIAIEGELYTRQEELDLVVNFQNELFEIRNVIQRELYFEKFLGDDLWLEFCIYRREDLYQNQNYISDGLTNEELFKKAEEFIDVANKEIIKSSELQHSITATLKNLLMIPKFKKLVKKFSTGNWIRVLIDREIYKLRLLSYEINHDNTAVLNVEFSDVLKTADGMTDQQDIFAKMISMTTSYQSTQRQASQGAESNVQIDKWLANGLDATTTKIINTANNQTQEWDSHGMLFREYDSIAESYSDEQLKIINSTIAFTDDNWKSSVTAVGKFHYIDPRTQESKRIYGINGEALVGKLILGESLGIYTNNGRLSFDDSGLVVTNDTNTVTINPNEESIISVTNKNDEKLLSFDEDGSLSIVGKIRVKNIEFDEGVMIKADKIDTLHSVAVSGNYNELNNLPKLSTVALSGEYSDLSGVPVLQSSIVSSNTLNPVNGSAVYNFAISAGKSGYDANRILCTDASGVASWYTVEQLKTILGI